MDCIQNETQGKLFREPPSAVELKGMFAGLTVMPCFKFLFTDTIKSFNKHSWECVPGRHKTQQTVSSCIHLTSVSHAPKF